MENHSFVLYGRERIQVQAQELWERDTNSLVGMYLLEQKVRQLARKCAVPLKKGLRARMRNVRKVLFIHVIIKEYYSPQSEMEKI